MPNVDPSNAEQHRSWNGEQGDYWTAMADRFDEGVAEYQDQFLAAAEITPTTTVLDIGCGSGRTTRDAASRAPDGSALGVDLSAGMIELARRRAAEQGLTNVGFVQADAQIHPFPERHFDLAVSRHGTMFFGDPTAAFANIARAIRPGGRLVLLTWQPFRRNEWLATFRNVLAAGRDLPMPPPDAPGPTALGDPDRIRSLLTATGFSGVDIRPITKPMYFGRDVDDAHRFVTGIFGWLTNGLDPEAKASALDDLRADLASHLSPGGVHYGSACWLVRAERP